MNTQTTETLSLSALLAMQADILAKVAAAKEAAIGAARTTIETLVAERAAAIAIVGGIDSRLADARANLAALVPPVNGPKPRRTSSPSAVNGAPNPIRNGILAALTDGPKTTKQLIEAVPNSSGSNIDYWLVNLRAAGLIHTPERGVHQNGPGANFNAETATPTDAPAPSEMTAN